MSQNPRPRNPQQKPKRRPAPQPVEDTYDDIQDGDMEVYESDEDQPTYTGDEDTYEDDTAPATVVQFEKFRARALKVSGTGERNKIVTNDPFVLTEEQGFDPPLKLEKPSFAVRMGLQDALGKNDYMRALQLMFGGQINRVLLVLDRYERHTGNDSDNVLVGMLMEYMEHFYGEGAMDESFFASLT